MIKSYTNLLLSVRQITQTNKGKQTAGIDKEVINTPAQRVELVNTWDGGNQKPVRRVEIPKKNGKMRPLGIPTVRDRVMQAIVKTALEPEWESRFEPNSYGFRPSRSCQDAIEQSFTRLSDNPRGSNDKWILEADIKGFFDNLAHESILSKISNFPKRNQRLGKSHWSKGSKYYSVAQNQSWICHICGEPLLNGEEIETHHILPVAQGGTDDEYNLQHVHLACHKQVHSKTQFQKARS